MFNEWYKPNACLEFPVGGSQALVAALIRCANLYSACLLLASSAWYLHPIWLFELLEGLPVVCIEMPVCFAYCTVCSTFLTVKGILPVQVSDRLKVRGVPVCIYLTGP
jgi:hypothetical protein